MLEEYNSREAASAATANYIAAALCKQLQQRSSKAGFVVSGGSTPARCFSLLAEKPLAWDRVQVSLTDERNVMVTDQDSNERLVREHLIQNLAVKTEFVNLDPMNQKKILSPVACTLIGMGEDGHFASLFPDLEKLEQYLDPDQPAKLISVKTQASSMARTSMTLSGLIDSESVLVLAFGERKRGILLAPAGYPIDALIKNCTGKLKIIWAP